MQPVWAYMHDRRRYYCNFCNYYSLCQRQILLNINENTRKSTRAQTRALAVSCEEVFFSQYAYVSFR